MHHLKNTLFSLIVSLFALSAVAQKLQVVSFEAALTDNTAWNPSTCHKLDDGRYCPIVKVEFNAPSCAFEGGVIEGKAPLFKTNEYWVYMLRIGYFWKSRESKISREPMPGGGYHTTYPYGVRDRSIYCRIVLNL